MEELLLCSRPVSKVPYYLEGVGVNVYSMEELSYCIIHNAILLDRSFMRKELCNWIREQMNLPVLAADLERMVREKAQMSDFAYRILWEVGYCSRKEAEQVRALFLQLREKTEFERGKIRADQLLENRRFHAAAAEYQKLLARKDTERQTALLQGAVWHNLGVADSGLFLFSDAAACFEKAYSLNEKPQSLRQALLACLCAHDEETFLAMAEKYRIAPSALSSLRQEVQHALDCRELADYEAQLEYVFAGKEENTGRFRRQTDQMIRDIKNSYLTNCSI